MRTAKFLAGSIGFDHDDLAAQQDDGVELIEVEFRHDLVDGGTVLGGFGVGDFLLGADETGGTGDANGERFGTERREMAMGAVLGTAAAATFIRPDVS